MSVPFGSRTNRQAENGLWKSLQDPVWDLPPAGHPVPRFPAGGPRPSAPLAGHRQPTLPVDIPDEFDRAIMAAAQKEIADDGLGPSRGIITGCAIVLVIIGVLWATWDAADWFGLI